MVYLDKLTCASDEDKVAGGCPSGLHRAATLRNQQSLQRQQGRQRVRVWLCVRSNRSANNVESWNEKPKDARKLEQELGWRPAETFESGIRKTVQRYLANPQWVSNVQSGPYYDWIQVQYAAA